MRTIKLLAQIDNYKMISLNRAQKLGFNNFDKNKFINYKIYIFYFL